ncbi:MAG: AI-2E family transporter [Methylococcaceae bacterium]|nr:AI-2E family transporter [Methylococcaceae bacterium]
MINFQSAPTHRWLIAIFLCQVPRDQTNTGKLASEHSLEKDANSRERQTPLTFRRNTFITPESIEVDSHHSLKFPTVSETNHSYDRMPNPFICFNLFSMTKNTPYILFLTFVLLVTVSFFYLIKDFLLACFWAIILAVVFYPAYQGFRQYFKNSEKLPLFLTMLMIILVFVIPLLTITLMITEESTNYYNKIQSGEINPQVYFENTLTLLLPKFNKLSHIPAFSVEEISASAGNAFAQAVKYIAQQVPALTQNLLNLIVQVALAFYILFFLLRDGHQLIRKLISLIPIGEGIEIALFERFTSVARATVKGGLIVAVIQGSIGGLLFWFVGIPAAFLWGMLMIVLSLLPIGSTLIWGPAAVILLLQGQTLKAAIVLTVGILVIGMIDNFLRPRLIGKDIKMSDYLVLVSTLGGLTWFSLTGFVLGPIVAALFITCWDIMGQDSQASKRK